MGTESGDEEAQLPQGWARTIHSSMEARLDIQGSLPPLIRLGEWGQ